MKIIKKNFDGKLKGRFFNTCKFSNHNNNKFILLLQKGVYPYEYMDDETSLPGKKDFYSNLNIEYITSAVYVHIKFVKIL